MLQPDPAPIVKRLNRRRVSPQHGSLRGAKVLRVWPDESTRPSPAHLVIAEDDRDMRRFLVESFEEEGYRVTEAEDGEQLHRRLLGPASLHGAAVPDIVISDIRLPGLTGLDLLAELRESDWSLPVILITAFGDESVHREGRRLGAAMVLDKPFDVEDLVEAVQALVPSR